MVKLDIEGNRVKVKKHIRRINVIQRTKKTQVYGYQVEEVLSKLRSKGKIKHNAEGREQENKTVRI